MTIPIRVLLVEDSQDDAELVLIQLRRDGLYPAWYRVDTEPAFLERLDPPPEIILADWSMPRFSGLRALELLAQNQFDLPLIIVSGKIGEEAAMAATRLGAYDYVSKDNLTRLGPAIRRALEQKRLRDERNRSEQALKESEQRFRQILTTANEGIWAIDAQENTTLVNKKMADMFGYQIDELIGSPVSDLIFPEDMPEYHYRRQRRQHGENDIFERRYRRKDGSTLWALISTTVLLGPNGEYQGAFAMVTDLRERKANEQALFRSQQHLNRLVESATSGIVSVELDGRFLQANSAFCKILGYTLDELRQMHIGDVVSTDDDPTAAETLKDLALGLRESMMVDQRYIRKDGSLIWGHTVASAVRDQENKVIFLAGIIEDITERKRADEALRQRTRELETVFNLSKELRGATTENEILGVISREMRQAIKIEGMIAVRVEPGSETYHITYADSPIAANLDKIIPLQGSLVEQTIQSQGEYIAVNLSERPGRTKKIKGSTQVGPTVMIKMQSERGLFGAIGFGRLVGEPFFTPEEIHMLTAVTDLAGNALRRVRLFDDLRLANDQAIEGWSRAMDMRDHETEDHSQQVTELTMRLADLMGVDPSERLNIWRGARLHDIGKLAIPDSILWKPGPLDDEEWDIMRKHPEWARQMLEPIPFLHPALDIPYCHHEHWDGSGYPRGLKGDEIPISARIFAVADVYQALTCNRPYRKAWEEQRAVEYVIAQSGTHFDPRVVEAFITLCGKRAQ